MTRYAKLRCRTLFCQGGTHRRRTNRLKLTALRDQLDSLIDEAGRRELTIRESLALFCEREIARRDQRRIDMGFGLARFPFVRDPRTCSQSA